MMGQAGYYKAEQDTLQSQLISPSSLTPVAPALSSLLQEPVQLTQPATTTTQQASSPKLAKLPNPPVFTEDTQTDEISLDVWKIKIFIYLFI